MEGERNEIINDSKYDDAPPVNPGYKNINNFNNKNQKNYNNFPQNNNINDESNFNLFSSFPQNNITNDKIGQNKHNLSIDISPKILRQLSIDYLIDLISFINGYC